MVCVYSICMELGTEIVQKISRLEEKDVEEMPVLYEKVSPDSLDRVVRSFEDKESFVQFNYYNYIVKVYGDKTIELDKI